MRVVDEETLHATDLETEAPSDPPPEREEDAETPKVPPLERAPAPRPEPEFIGPEEEVEFTPVKPKRKPRKPKDAFKGEILVPALEKRDAFVEPSKLRKDRLKEKIECPNGCGKLITRHAASYTHDKTCPALKRQETEMQTEEIVVKEPDFDRKEAEKRLRKPPEVPPDVEFMERIKRTAWAYRQLEETKHSSLIRQYYGR